MVRPQKEFTCKAEEQSVKDQGAFMQLHVHSRELESVKSKCREFCAATWNDHHEDTWRSVRGQCWWSISYVCLSYACNYVMCFWRSPGRKAPWACLDMECILLLWPRTCWYKQACHNTCLLKEWMHEQNLRTMDITDISERYSFCDLSRALGPSCTTCLRSLLPQSKALSSEQF